MAYSFWLSCHTNLLPWWNRSKTETFSGAEMSHVPFGTSCFFNSSSQAGRDAALLFVLGKSAFSIIQLLSYSMLPFIGQSRKRVGHTVESCVWLRWYSTDGVRDNDIVFFVCLLEHDAWYCSNTRCSSPAVQVSWSGVPLLVFTVRMKEWHRQRAKVHLWLFPHPSSTSWPGLLQLWLEEERGGAGSTDQGPVVISLCVNQRSGAVSGSSPSSPLHQPWCPPSTHFSPDQSSRTCKQRWPPLALHCQRMMQQRHRRWPPPWTEGGGVTGAK